MKTLQKLSVVSLFTNRTRKSISTEVAKLTFVGLLSTVIAFPWSSAFAGRAAASTTIPRSTVDGATARGTASLWTHSAAGTLTNQNKRSRNLPVGSTPIESPTGWITVARVPYGPPIWGIANFRKPAIPMRKNPWVESDTVSGTAHGNAYARLFDDGVGTYKLFAQANVNPIIGAGGGGTAAASAVDPISVQPGLYTYAPEISFTVEHDEREGWLLSFSAEDDFYGLLWSVDIFTAMGDCCATQVEVEVNVNHEVFYGVSDEEIRQKILLSLDPKGPILSTSLTLFEADYDLSYAITPVEYSQGTQVASGLRTAMPESGD